MTSIKKIAAIAEMRRQCRNAARIARSIVAVDFPNKQEYREYMHKHPGADPANHRIVEHGRKKAPPPVDARKDRTEFPDTGATSPRKVRKVLGEDAVIKTFPLEDGGIAFAWKNAAKDGDQYRLVIGGKEVAKGNTAFAYDSKRWMVEDENGVQHLYSDGKEVASGQDVESWTDDMWSATDMSGISRMFFKGEEVDSIDSSKGRLDGVTDGVWVKTDFEKDRASLVVNGVPIAEADDIRRVVSDKGVESDGLVNIDGETVDSKSYKDFVRDPNFWSKFVKGRAKPFYPGWDNQGPKQQRMPSDLGLPVPRPEKTVSVKRHRKGQGYFRHEYKWNDIHLAEGLLKKFPGVSDNAVKEMAGYKLELAQSTDRFPRSVSDFKKEFLENMGESNYEDELEFKSSKKALSEIPDKYFGVLLALIVPNEKDEG